MKNELMLDEELQQLDECEFKIKNIGWTLGNECPYRCTHCYSMLCREKGMDLTIEMIDRVVDQVSQIGVETINVGGNEPLFTNGLNAKKTLLPYIIREITKRGIKIGLTTSGVTAIYLEKNFPEEFKMLNDIDISFDSPFEEEHNKNRGANLYSQAIAVLEMCQKYNKDHTIVMCAMKWNFSEDHLRALVSIAKKYDANIRINMMKPTESKHIENMATYEQYFKGYKVLNSLCNVIDMTDPIVAGASGNEKGRRCPCGRTSFRIHSITPDGKIPIAPCVYLHDFKVGNILEDDLKDLIESPQFRLFRKRNANPNLIEDCGSCRLVNTCGGGCAAMAYLYRMHKTGEKSLFSKDPYCSKEHNASLPSVKIQKDASKQLVHMDYLCTWIGSPIK